MYPEGFEFDLENGTDELSIAGSQAAFYFGEDGGKNSQQSGIIGFVIGYFWNVATIYMTLPFAPKALAEIINQVVSLLMDVLGGWAILIILPALPFIIASELAYAISIMVWAFSQIPIWILMAIFGINANREQDIITWFLGIEELGYYDPVNDPIGNMFEIPEAREYFIRTVDTGFESTYGVNPAFAGMADRADQAVTDLSDWGVVYKEDLQEMYISNFYKSVYPDRYE